MWPEYLQFLSDTVMEKYMKYKFNTSNVPSSASSISDKETTELCCGRLNYYKQIQKYCNYLLSNN